MFITKKALREKIEEAIAKERERMEMQNWIDSRLRENSEEINYLRQTHNKRLCDMDTRICKLEGKHPNEVKAYENS